MSQKFPRPKQPAVLEAQNAAPPAQPNVYVQQNQFFRESVPEPGKLGRMRSDAPELYTAYVEQFKLEAEHSRAMQLRAIAIDERVVPQLPRNDLIGIIAGWSIAIAALGLSFFCVMKGLPYGWAPAIIVALPTLVSAFKGKSS